MAKKVLKILSVLLGSAVFTAHNADDAALAAPAEFVEKKLNIVDKPFITGRYKYTVRSGDTLNSILRKHKIKSEDASKISSKVSKKVNIKKLRAGDEIEVVINYDRKFQSHLSRISFKLDSNDISILKTAEKEFTTKIQPLTTDIKIVRKRGTVKTNIDALARSQGIPANILLSFVNALKHEVNFKKDIRKNSEIEVLYEQYVDAAGDKIKDGDLLYASLVNSGKEKEIYRFSPTGRSVDAKYYNSTGNLMAKKSSNMFEPPLKKMYITSRFGMRKHPIYKVRKMHKGVDFRGKTGTPVYATAAGKVDRKTRMRGYGNYLRVDHANGYKSAYAHLHKFARGLKKGDYVKKGELIAYVGNTGASTGPHLHFEIIKGKKHINPMQAIKLPVDRSLKGKKLALFKRSKKKIDNMLTEAVALNSN